MPLLVSFYENLRRGTLDKMPAPKTEKGNWKYKFHQSLTPEVGKEHLKKQTFFQKNNMG